MFNINDLQKYACLKMEIFLKQPREIVAEIEKEFAEYKPGYGFGKDERYLIYYAMCEDILLRRAKDLVVVILTEAVRQKEDYTLLFSLTKLQFPVQIVIDVCADILKGK